MPIFLFSAFFYLNFQSNRWIRIRASVFWWWHVIVLFCFIFVFLWNGFEPEPRSHDLKYLWSRSPSTDVWLPIVCLIYRTQWEEQEGKQQKNENKIVIIFSFHVKCNRIKSVHIHNNTGNFRCNRNEINVVPCVLLNVLFWKKIALYKFISFKRK